MAREADVVDRMVLQWGEERPELDCEGLAIVLRLGLLAGLQSRRLKRTLAPAALAPWEFDVLSALRRSGVRQGLSPTELCASAQLSSGAMTHRIDRLEERRLVRRRRGGADRRSIRVQLTAQGRQLVDRVMQDRVEDAEAFVAALGRRERRELAGLLRKLLLSLDVPADGR